MGQTIRFPEGQIRAMGRNAAGVRGIRLKGKDEIVGMDVVAKDATGRAGFLIVLSQGFGKLSPVKDYRLQSRGGSGVKTAKVTPKTGEVVAGFVYDPKQTGEGAKEDIILISQKGQVIRLPLPSVPTLSRTTQGVRLMRFRDGGDKVASVAFV
jgi:DNA gyrase subunit A